MDQVATDKMEIPDTPEIRRQANYANHMKQRWDQAQLRLKEMVEDFQIHICEHDWMPIKKWDSNYHDHINSRWGMDVYTGKKCKICKLFAPRQSGDPSHVCHKCGGKMKPNGITPGQGSRLHWHICENCGHEFAHT